ncbi:PAS domain-containing sensor histidine kinase [Halobacterium litoreum]|uniref:histidine kinase n=1 Tax=Halobacterium litoreum TaxID=2039234 RepID=A0ABD5NC63_9EURY|nr:PAS domain-containing sensor histidine kinase [Halobacterium litoreum]UHH14428.1 PAS domain-containing sensor histidine kinase [Halobacterium litoreum]
MNGDTEATRLAAFFNSSPDAILVVGSDGEIRRANDRATELFGYDRTELEGAPVERLVPLADRDDHPEHRDAYFENPSSRPMGAGLDLRGRRKDGSTFPVDISLSPVATGDEPEVIAAVRDTAEQERLRRKYRTLLETAPDAAVVADADTGEILEVNRAATDLVDATEDELVGRPQTALHPSEDAARYQSLFDSHRRGEQTTAARFGDDDPLLVETATGRRIPVEVSAQRTELQDQTVVVTMYRDVSERRRYERDLYHQIDRLERLSEVLSHDLRNPLNVAEGNLELARESEDWERLENVERAHDRMRDIVEDALTMVRGGAEVNAVEPLELAAVVDECWENVATADATLTVATDGVLYADENRATHLFENLFRNAIEHGGDSVAVTVGVSDDGFFVADDGPGIPAEERESVFESGWTTASDGSGLGLSIVADIAAAHDWTVDATESADGGARFEFRGVRTAPYDDAFATDD